MRKFLFILSLAFGLHSFGQPYGNEWIDYSKPHYKIKVPQDGWYRIPYTTLSAFIPNLNSINPDNVVMYHNGKKVPIYVSSIPGAGVFTFSDFIEFYGVKNIGDVDSSLYQSGYLQPHTNTSFFTDTSVFFLTTNNQTNNPRYQVIANNLTSLPPKEEYFWQSSKFVPPISSFFGGKPYAVGTSILFSSKFEAGEGYTAWVGAGNQCKSMSLPANSLYTAGPTNATVNYTYSARFNDLHDITVSLNGNTIHSNIFNDYDYRKLSLPVPVSNLSATNTLKHCENVTSASSNQDAVLFAELIYPRKYEFDNTSTFHFNMPANSGNRYIEINNYADNGTQPFLIDISNGLIIQSTDLIGVYPKKFLLPAAAGERELYLRSNDNSTVNWVTSLTPTTFKDYTSSTFQGDYLIISHPSLMQDTAGNNYIDQYISHRKTSAGGSFAAQKYDIDQLTDQFAYGVTHSPLAIRNFISYGKDVWTVNKPKYVFLIGKAITYYTARTSSVLQNLITVPSFGQPASDELLTSKRDTFIPQVGIGRLAAQNLITIKNYLDKVEEYEDTIAKFGDPNQTRSEKLWMKNVLQFSGGDDAYTNARIKGYMSDYKKIIEDSLWGTKATTFFKSTNIPITSDYVAEIIKAVDAGASFVNIFGHSAQAAFDIEIGPVGKWNNRGKYPILVANGCNAGNIHDLLPGLSQSYLFEPNKGVSAFLAASSTALENSLQYYTNLFIYKLSKQRYNGRLGDILAETCLETVNNTYGDDQVALGAYTMTLHGDPALKFNQYPTRDYEIDGASVTFNPSILNASIDSFDVNIAVANLGMATYDSIAICLTRKVNDANNNPISFDYKKYVKAPLYLDTVTFRLPTMVNSSIGLGQNSYDVMVDCENKFAEISETNNGVLGVQNTILSDDVVPIFPYEFAIVPKQQPLLKASTVNPFAPLRKYILQMDTSEKFKTIVAQTSVTQVGGVIHWQIPTSLTFRDSTVYYWRVSKDSTSPTNTFRWGYSSFLYLKNEYPGWNQSHFFQYAKDKYPDYVYIDTPTREFKFAPNIHHLHTTSGWADAQGGNIPFNSLTWYLNASPQYAYRMGGCGFNAGVTFAVLDKITGQPWISHVASSGNFAHFGNWHCSGKPDDQKGFDFSVVGIHPTLNIPWSKVISNFLDSIPNGNFIVMYSNNRPIWENVDTNLVNKLYALGATKFPIVCHDSLRVPYTFFCQKGTTVHDDAMGTGTNFTTQLDKDFYFTSNWYTGTYSSPKIGPAKEWGSFHWRFRPKEIPNFDNQSVDLIGITNSGVENTLLSTQTLDTTIIWIDAKVYPYLKLRMHTDDTVMHTPSQLYYWRVLYKKVPEAAINPAAYFAIASDSLQLGDTLDVKVALENVSDVNMDSMLVLNTVQNVSTNSTINLSVRHDSLPIKDTMILHVRMPIDGSNFTGNNRLIIEANPNNDQPEQFHFNNYAVINFKTQGDKINPLLDVTFDGVHILNGDLVSSKPDISISLKDENKHKALDDSSLVQVYLKYPNEANPRLVNYDNSILTFIPATGNIAKNNRAKVEFKPNQLNDGKYELFVKDKDKSNNSSSNQGNQYIGLSKYDFRISFEVLNKSTISNVLNYPNPFTSSTRFIFTLTGSEIPDFFKIQIMTVSGRVVKEIMKDEIGPIHIGRNMTQYAWNGTDSYGDKLANGVYFYRVVTNINQKEIERLASSSGILQHSDFDKYFKQGIGKMVILR